MNLVARWNAIPPAIREPIRSAAISAAWGAQTAALVLVGSAASDGQISSPQALGSYFLGHWWGAFIGLVLPAAYRARQAQARVANTVTLADGTSAVVTPPTPQKVPA